MTLTKKQKNTLTISQLYQYYISPKRHSRDFFQKVLQELGLPAYEIGTTLGRIRDENIFNLENFSLIVYHPLPSEIGSGLIQLHHSNLLTTENKKILEKHTNPEGIALVLRLLNSVNLLTAANKMMIENHNDPHLLAKIFFTLFYSNLFTQKNFDKIMVHPHLQSLSNKLQEFNRIHSLTQTQLEKLTQVPPEQLSLSHEETEPKKIIFSSKSKRSVYPCKTSLFYVQKQQQDSESLCQKSGVVLRMK